MESTPTIPISAADRALLLAATDPKPPQAGLPDHLSLAHFLLRPDIRPHLEALQAYRAFRAEIERDHLLRRAAEILLDVARETDDLAEKRRAAVAISRLVSTSRAPRQRSGSVAAPTPGSPAPDQAESPRATTAPPSPTHPATCRVPQADSETRPWEKPAAHARPTAAIQTHEIEPAPALESTPVPAPAEDDPGSLPTTVASPPFHAQHAPAADGVSPPEPETRRRDEPARIPIPDRASQVGVAGAPVTTSSGRDALEQAECLRRERIRRFGLSRSPPRVDTS